MAEKAEKEFKEALQKAIDADEVQALISHHDKRMAKDYQTKVTDKKKHTDAETLIAISALSKSSREVSH